MANISNSIEYATVHHRSSFSPIFSSSTSNTRVAPPVHNTKTCSKKELFLKPEQRHARNILANELPRHTISGPKKILKRLEIET